MLYVGVAHADSHMALELELDTEVRSQSSSPAKKKRKKTKSNRDFAGLKIFEDAEKSDVRITPEGGGELFSEDQQLWLFQLPKDVGLNLIEEEGTLILNCSLLLIICQQKYLHLWKGWRMSHTHF